jgi:CheY-like chemotaxis protein
MEMASDKLLQGSRILVAEDEPFVAFEIVVVLRMAGAEVLGPALSLTRTIELATAEHVDCAVLDVMLRDGLVFPAARLLRQQSAGLVFHASYFPIGRLKQGWPRAQILTKPASPELLLIPTDTGDDRCGVIPAQVLSPT